LRNLRIIRHRILGDDRGDGIFVMAVFMVMFLLLCAAFAIDLTKNVYVKSSYVNIAQAAADLGSQQINIEGNIDPYEQSGYTINNDATTGATNYAGASLSTPAADDQGAIADTINEYTSQIDGQAAKQGNSGQQCGADNCFSGTVNAGALSHNGGC
jgi:Flp pilus assembly protein TadG